MMLVLALGLGTASALGCGDRADRTGETENENEGSQGGRGGRGVVDLEGLLDAGAGQDGGADASTTPIADAGNTPLPDADTPDPDAGPMLDADVPVGPPPVVPDDPGARGPWPVGVRTATVSLAGKAAPVEIWYPATIGSEVGKSQEVYDFVQWLPPEAQEDVPSADKPVPVTCNCYRDLPIDAAHGPYPAVVFVHNIGAFRVASAGIMAHWASRGFIVVALDHPLLILQDVLAYASLGWCTSSGITEDTMRKRDVAAELAALRAPADSFAFLSGAVDTTRMAVVGHSEGAPYAVGASGEEGVRFVMLWNSNLTVAATGDLQGVAYVTGAEDTSTTGRPSAVLSAYTNATLPAIMVSADGAAHLSMTELCHAKSASGRGGMEIASRYGLCDIDYALLSLAWDCDARYLDQPSANERFGFATAAALEQLLLGKDRAAAFERFDANWGSARLPATD